MGLLNGNYRPMSQSEVDELFCNCGAIGDHSDAVHYTNMNDQLMEDEFMGAFPR